MRLLAPETLLRGCLTKATDVFSFGVLLWELFVLVEGRVPDFSAPDVAVCIAEYTKLMTEEDLSDVRGAPYDTSALDAIPLFSPEGRAVVLTDPKFSVKDSSKNQVAAAGGLGESGMTMDLHHPYANSSPPGTFRPQTSSEAFRASLMTPPTRGTIDNGEGVTRSAVGTAAEVHRMLASSASNTSSAYPVLRYPTPPVPLLPRPESCPERFWRAIVMPCWAAPGVRVEFSHLLPLLAEAARQCQRMEMAQSAKRAGERAAAGEALEPVIQLVPMEVLHVDAAELAASCNPEQFSKLVAEMEAVVGPLASTPGLIDTSSIDNPLSPGTTEGESESGTGGSPHPSGTDTETEGGTSIAGRRKKGGRGVGNDLTPVSAASSSNLARTRSRFGRGRGSDASLLRTTANMSMRGKKLKAGRSRSRQSVVDSEESAAEEVLEPLLVTEHIPDPTIQALLAAQIATQDDLIADLRNELRPVVAEGNVDAAAFALVGSDGWDGGERIESLGRPTDWVEDESRFRQARAAPAARVGVAGDGSGPGGRASPTLIESESFNATMGLEWTAMGRSFQGMGVPYHRVDTALHIYPPDHSPTLMGIPTAASGLSEGEGRSEPRRSSVVWEGQGPGLPGLPTATDLRTYSAIVLMQAAMRTRYAMLLVRSYRPHRAAALIQSALKCFLSRAKAERRRARQAGHALRLYREYTSHFPVGVRPATLGLELLVDMHEVEEVPSLAIVLASTVGAEARNAEVPQVAVAYIDSAGPGVSPRSNTSPTTGGNKRRLRPGSATSAASMHSEDDDDAPQLLVNHGGESSIPSDHQPTQAEVRQTEISVPSEEANPEATHEPGFGVDVVETVVIPSTRPNSRLTAPPQSRGSSRGSSHFASSSDHSSDDDRFSGENRSGRGIGASLSNESTRAGRSTRGGRGMPRAQANTLATRDRSRGRSAEGNASGPRRGARASPSPTRTTRTDAQNSPASPPRRRVGVGRRAAPRSASGTTSPDAGSGWDAEYETDDNTASRERPPINYDPNREHAHTTEAPSSVANQTHEQSQALMQGVQNAANPLQSSLAAVADLDDVCNRMNEDTQGNPIMPNDAENPNVTGAIPSTELDNDKTVSEAEIKELPRVETEAEIAARKEVEAQEKQVELLSVEQWSGVLEGTEAGRRTLVASHEAAHRFIIVRQEWIANQLVQVVKLEHRWRGLIVWRAARWAEFFRFWEWEAQHRVVVERQQKRAWKIVWAKLEGIRLFGQKIMNARRELAAEEDKMRGRILSVQAIKWRLLMSESVADTNSTFWRERSYGKVYNRESYTRALMEHAQDDERTILRAYENFCKKRLVLTLSERADRIEGVKLMMAYFAQMTDVRKIEMSRARLMEAEGEERRQMCREEDGDWTEMMRAELRGGRWAIRRQQARVAVQDCIFEEREARANLMTEEQRKHQWNLDWFRSRGRHVMALAPINRPHTRLQVYAHYREVKRGEAKQFAKENREKERLRRERQLRMEEEAIRASLETFHLASQLGNSKPSPGMSTINGTLNGSLAGHPSNAQNQSNSLFVNPLSQSMPLPATLPLGGEGGEIGAATMPHNSVLSPLRVVRSPPFVTPKLPPSPFMEHTTLPLHPHTCPCCGTQCVSGCKPTTWPENNATHMLAKYRRRTQALEGQHYPSSPPHPLKPLQQKAMAVRLSTDTRPAMVEALAAEVYPVEAPRLLGSEDLQDWADRLKLDAQRRKMNINDLEQKILFTRKKVILPKEYLHEMNNRLKQPKSRSPSPVGRTAAPKEGS